MRQRDLLHYTDSLISNIKTLAVLTKDNRSGINGGEWYGVEIWHMFEKHHLRFKEMFEGMQN